MDDERRPTGELSEAARRAAQRYGELGQRVLQSAPVEHQDHDADGVIQYVNPYFEKLSGYRLAEVQGKDWFATFLPGRDHDRIRALFKTSFSGTRMRDNVNPIWIRTGYAAPDDVARALAAGFDHHVAKPISIGRLLDLLG